MPRLSARLDHTCKASRHLPAAPHLRRHAHLQRAPCPCQPHGTLFTLVARSTVCCASLATTLAVRTSATQQHRSSSTTQQLDAPLLTALITQCHDYVSIQRLLQQHRPQLNHIHASAMVVRSAHLAAVVSWSSAPNEAQAPATTAAAAHKQEEQLLQFLLDLLDLVSSQLQHYTARQVANTLWALSKLAVVTLQAPASPPQPANGNMFSAQTTAAAAAAATATATAAATATATSAASPAAGVVAGPAAPHPDPLLQTISDKLRSVVRELQASCEDHWHSFTISEVAMLLHAAAALDSSGIWASDSAWLQQCLVQLELSLGQQLQKQQHWVTADQYTASQPQQQLQQPKSVEQQQSGHVTVQDQAVIWLALQQLQLRPPLPLQKQLLDRTLASAAAYTGRDTANVLHAQAALKVAPDGQWLAAFLCATQLKLHTASGRDLCSMLYALACMRHVPPASWLDACLPALQSSLSSCTFHELCLAMYGLARLRIRPSQPWILKLLNGAAMCVQEACPQDGAMLLWALARLTCHPDEAWLQAQLHRHVASAGAGSDAGAARNVAGILWSLGRMGYVPPAVLLRQLVSVLTPLDIRAAQSQSLACLLYGLAKLRCRPPRQWLACYMQAVAGSAGDMTLQGLAMVLWSLVGMQVHPSDRWLNTICKHLRRHLESSSNASASAAQAAALMLWALAKMGHRPDWDVLQAVLDTVLLPASTSGVLPQTVALTAYACAKLGAKRAGGQVWQLLFVTAKQLHTYKPQDVSNILWALGTLRQPPPDGWLQEMCACTTSNLQQFTYQQLANAAWGLLKLKVLPPQQWMEALAAEHLTRQQAKLGTPRDHATLHNALRTWQMDNALVRIS